MSFDVFISYSWSSETTKTFVHGLAAHLQTVGFNVGIDLDVDYGNSLSEFMSSIHDAKHVLMVADTSYVERANTVPSSGVDIENRWISKMIDDKPDSWLSVAFVNQGKLPSWLKGRNPKGFVFNLADEISRESKEIDHLWRWLAGLPASAKNAISPSTMRKRLTRIEKIDNARDSSRWSDPSTRGTIKFEFEMAPDHCFNIGYGMYSFTFKCTERSTNSVYLYNDHVKAIGLLPPEVEISYIDTVQTETCLNPSRDIPLRKGEKFILMNDTGALLVGQVKEIHYLSEQHENRSNSIEFAYRIIIEE